MDTCKDVLKLIPPYIDGEFTDNERNAVETHVSGCGHCREAVATERSFKAGLRAKLCPPREPSGLRARVSTSLDSADRTERPANSNRGPVVLPGFAVACAAAAMLVFAFAPTAQPHAGAVAAGAGANANASASANASANDRNSAQVATAAPRPLAPTPVASMHGSRSVNLERVSITMPTARGPKTVWVEAFDPRTVQFQRMQRRRIGRHDVWLTRSGRMTRVLYQRDGKAYSMTSEAGADELLRLVAHQLHGEQR